jgi:hypothetical protein
MVSILFKEKSLIMRKMIILLIMMKSTIMIRVWIWMLLLNEVMHLLRVVSILPN